MDKLAFRCKPLDDLLGGGLERSSITEIYGDAGSGKTNICLQAARECASSGKKVAYLGSERISMERLSQISQTNEYKKILQNILFFNPSSLEEQERMIHKAIALNDIALIIIDTINGLYRIKVDHDQAGASRSLTRQITDLQLAARKHDLYVILTAQVYTAENGDIKPFAVRNIEPMVKTILKLEKTDMGERRATLIKHPSQPAGKQVVFRITAWGLA
jgi:DNA repair protein RadB